MDSQRINVDSPLVVLNKRFDHYYDYEIHLLIIAYVSQ